jgi:hypothetical protein
MDFDSDAFFFYCHEIAAIIITYSSWPWIIYIYLIYRYRYVFHKFVVCVISLDKNDSISTQSSGVRIPISTGYTQRVSACLCL